MSAQQVSRRSVARGAAWSVPLVAVGVAAPAFAVSPGSRPTLSAVAGCRCGNGGGSNKPYRLDVTFVNNLGTSFTITNPAIILPSDTAAGVALQASPPQTNVIPANTTKTLRYTFTRGNNGGTQVGFNYTITDVNGSTDVVGALMTITWGMCTSACVY